MARCPEATRQFRPERGDTSLQFKELLASIALEMMVMGFAGYFVPGGVAGNIYRLQPSLVHQRLDVAIDRRLAKSRMMALRALQNFVRRQWPVGFEKGVANRCFLPGIYASFHGN